MGYSNVLKYQEDLVKKYKYKPLPPLVRDEVLSFYKDNLPEGFSFDGANVPLYSSVGLMVCSRYNRIVIGDYGAYVEVLPEDVIHANIKVKKGQEYRDYDERYSKHTKYSWLTSNDASDMKIYFQKKTVDYADYIPGRYYISPHECFLSKSLQKCSAASVCREQINVWLNKQGVFSDKLLDYYESLSSLHSRALEYSIANNVFPGDFEYWVRLNEVCELEDGLSYEQFSAVRYNLSLIHCSVDELKGQLLSLKEDVRTAILLGLEEFSLPCDAEKLQSNEVRMLLNMSAESLLKVMHLSKVLAGCKSELGITDVDSLIEAAECRVQQPFESCRDMELV